jgi:hypothetical protein
MMTQWVEAQPGEAVHWEWGSDRPLVNFAVEATGLGVYAGGDQYGGRGCLYGEAPFRLRIWWGHSNTGGVNQPAEITWSITVAPLAGECTSFDSVIGSGRSNDAMLPPQGPLGAATVLCASTGTALLVWGSWLNLRRGRT